MHLALALCLAASLPADAPAADNLDFHTGTLAGWEGEGFVIAPAGRHGPTLECAVCSSDCGPAGRKAMIHRTITIPPGAGVLRFTAHAVRGAKCPANDNLDVVLLAAGKRVIPKQVRKGADWQTAASILPAENGLARIRLGRAQLRRPGAARCADRRGQAARLLPRLRRLPLRARRRVRRP